jgi:2-phosphoglycerate kinase
LVAEQLLIFIGGATAAGKTTTAKALAAELGAGWLQVDIIWLAVKAAFPEGSAERNLLALDELGVLLSTPPEVLAARHKLASAFICGTLDAPIAHTLHHHRVVVVDGAWLLPEWVAAFASPGVTVRGVFIHEAEAREITLAMKQRKGVTETLPFQKANAAAAWIRGNALAEEARRVGLPVVEARPRATLLARVRGAVGV